MTSKGKGNLFGVRAPGTLVIFFVSSVLSLSLCFQPTPENTAVLSAYGWGHGPHFWQGELWRLWGSQLLHTKIWHFACNAYWLLLFGPVLEKILGSRRYLLSMFFAAWVIGLAGGLSWEAGGIGISGLLYFQFGFLVMLRKSEPAAARVCDGSTRFLLWGGLLLLGPALTFAGLVRVGNLVHLSGCLCGLAAGALYLRPAPFWRRALPGAAAFATLLFASTLLYAPVWDPQWHYWRAFNSDSLDDQLNHYSKSLEIDPENTHVRYNLGLAYFESGDLERAEALWLECAARAPEDSQVLRGLFSLAAGRGDADSMQLWNSRLHRLASLD